MTLLIVVIIAIALYAVLAYNGMIKLRNRVKEAWSDIDVQLKRRYNLIPNIIETVKGYAAHEEGVFTKVTEARAQAINATGIQEQGAAENMLSGALKSLFAVAEAYPDLKANENFMQLQNELVDTEDKIQSARRFHNSVVKDFNTKIQQFPAKIIAQLFKFKDEEFFEVEDEEQKENVEVDFNKDEKPADTAESEGDAVETPHEASSEEGKKEAPAKETPAEPDNQEDKGEEKEEEPAPEEAPAEETPDEEPAPEEPKEEAPAEPEPEPETPAEEEKPAEETPAKEEKAEEEKPAEETPAKEEKAEEPAPEEPKEEEAPSEEEKPAEDAEQAEMPLEDEEKKE